MADFGGRTVLDPHIDPDQAQAAATALRRTADRLHAPQADLDTALAAVLSPPRRGEIADVTTKVGAIALTAEQKARIRELLPTDLSDSDIAGTIGCTRRQVHYIRSTDRARAARDAKQADA